MVKLSLNVNVKKVDLIDDDIIVNYEFNNNGTKIVITETYDSINEKLKTEYMNNKKGFYYNLNDKILSFLALSEGKYEEVNKLTPIPATSTSVLLRLENLLNSSIRLDLSAKRYYFVALN